MKGVLGAAPHLGMAHVKQQLLGGTWRSLGGPERMDAIGGSRHAVKQLGVVTWSSCNGLELMAAPGMHILLLKQLMVGIGRC